MKILTIKNVTTNDVIFKSTELNALEILEIERRSVSFQIPELRGNWNSLFLINGSIALQEKEVPFEFIGKLNLLDSESGFSRLRFDLVQYDRTLWLQFLEHLQQKQIHAEKIFRSIKGNP